METLDSVLRVLESPAIIEVFAIVASWVMGSKWFKSKKLDIIKNNASSIYKIVNEIARKSTGKVEKSKEYLDRIDKLVKSYGYASMSSKEKLYAKSVAQEYHDEKKKEKMDYLGDIARIAYLSVEEYSKTRKFEEGEAASKKTEKYLDVIDSFLKARNYTPMDTEQRKTAENIAKQINYEEKIKIVNSAED